MRSIIRVKDMMKERMRRGLFADDHIRSSISHMQNLLVAQLGSGPRDYLDIRIKECFLTFVAKDLCTPTLKKTCLKSGSF